jgi:hypothetical protein
VLTGSSDKTPRTRFYALFLFVIGVISAMSDALVKVLLCLL